MHRLKAEFYRFYWLVALALFIGVTCYWAVFMETIFTTETVIPLIAFVSAILSFVFFVQKQKLEETRLFKELFEALNKRYECIKVKLNELVTDESKTNDELTRDQKNLLFTYFNLCAEEYLYYKRYHIFEEIWVAWTNGMAAFFHDCRIKKIWEEEEKSKSYYGFTLKKIEEKIKRAI